MGIGLFGCRDSLFYQCFPSAKFGQMRAFLKLQIICDNLKLGEMHDNREKIIDHFKLNFKAERPPPPQAQPQLNMAVEEKVEYL